MTLISLAKELDRFCGAIEQSELRLSEVSAEEMRSRTQAIISEADTMALPKRLIPAARSVGDAAWLLENLLLKSLAVVDDSTVVLDAAAWQETYAYTQKALEMLKSPARYYGADIDALEMAGGLYL